MPNNRYCLTATAVPLFIAAFAATAAACSCYGETPTSVKFKRNDLIFMGKVSSEIIHAPFDNRDYEFIALEVFKGATKGKKVLVQTGNGQGDCGARFAVGRHYLVFAEAEPGGKYSTNVCHYNKKYFPDGERQARDIRAESGSKTKDREQPSNERDSRHRK